MSRIFSGDIDTVEIPDGGLEVAPGIWLKKRVFDNGEERLIQLFLGQPYSASSWGGWQTMRTLFLRPATPDPRVKELREWVDAFFGDSETYVFVKQDVIAKIAELFPELQEKQG